MFHVERQDSGRWTLHCGDVLDPETDIQGIDGRPGDRCDPSEPPVPGYEGPTVVSSARRHGAAAGRGGIRSDWRGLSSRPLEQRFENRGPVGWSV